ncbi:MAG TPA: phosphoribosyltransferase family protein, partial [Acidimicrobiia bacterium]|nr:phosphoribosyltransferase family protein [Acidimicrobiia bacterium]
MPVATILDTEAIDAHVRRIGAEIASDHPDGVVLIGVLKGALIFLADLVRAVQGVDVSVDFISISRFAPDSGRVRLLRDIDIDIAGRDVVIVEDIVDTGLTLAYLMGQLRDRAPRQLRACALLDRPVRRIVPQEVHYRGVDVGDAYVLGYGLHVRDLYRNVPFIVRADRDVVVEAPDAYLADLYGHQSETEQMEAGGRVAAGPTE